MKHCALAIYTDHIVHQNFMVSSEVVLIYSDQKLSGLLCFGFEDGLIDLNGANQSRNCHSWPMKIAPEVVELEYVHSQTTISINTRKKEGLTRSQKSSFTTFSIVQITDFWLSHRVSEGDHVLFHSIQLLCHSKTRSLSGIWYWLWLGVCAFNFCPAPNGLLCWSWLRKAIGLKIWEPSWVIGHNREGLSYKAACFGHRWRGVLSCSAAFEGVQVLNFFILEIKSNHGELFARDVYNIWSFHHWKIFTWHYGSTWGTTQSTTCHLDRFWPSHNKKYAPAGCLTLRNDILRAWYAFLTYMEKHSDQVVCV